MEKPILSEKELASFKKYFMGKFRRYFFFIGSVGMALFAIKEIVYLVLLVEDDLIPFKEISSKVFVIFLGFIMSSLFYHQYLLNKVITYYESKLSNRQEKGLPN